jgi:peptidoglycan/xylan/chitin deacetylase (PgdA/CDA1 family)
VVTVRRVHRRGFLLSLAGGLATIAAGHGAADLGAGTIGGRRPAARAARRPPARVSPAAARRPPVFGAGPVDPPRGVVSRLPGSGTHLALTIDDGVNSEVVAAFVTLAARTGIRLTFFPNGRYRSWQDNAAALRPLVDSGQVALGNHTWSHPDVTTLDDRALTEEIRRNQQFLWSTFGVRTPFFRPPYGAHDARTDAVAADLGHPTIALWDGTLGDSTVLTPAQILAAARQWFTAQRIVIGHANHRPVAAVFGQLLALIEERRLQTVTLADVWTAPHARLPGAATGGAAHTP